MISTLILAITAVTASDSYVGSQSGVVMVPPCRDEAGELYPAVSYSEFISRGMQFLLKDQPSWFKGPPVTDESGKPLPPYFRHAKLRPNGDLYTQPVVDRNVVYPAFHHAIAIRAFLSYYVYAGDLEAMRSARELVDWNIAHSTPLNGKYGGLPYSTFSNGVAGGCVDGDAIMPDKAAIMALMYLRLHRATGDAIYYNSAKRIADVLMEQQSDEGTWPFRVNSDTGEECESYTSSVCDNPGLSDRGGARFLRRNCRGVIDFELFGGFVA